MVTADSVGQDPVNLFEFEELARQHIGKMAYDYYAAGANDEITLRENRLAYERIVIYPRMLRDVSKRSTVSTAFGKQIQAPIIVAPIAFQKMAHPDAELGMIKAASDAGTIMILSTLSTCSIEEVAAAASGNLWFQLYVYRDREVTASLVRRAEEAGCQALVLTVDSPILGKRENDERNCFHLPENIVAKNLVPAGAECLPWRTGESGLSRYIAALYDQSLSWKDLEWLRNITKLPILVKGILRADDAELAVQYGASGIVVSNHGGRQLDTAPATINVLARVAEVVDGRAEIYVDGGVRRGTDVLKALALGARAVLVGRPVLWGLASNGAAGAQRVLEILGEEFDLAMALSGCGSLNDIKRDLLSP